MQFDLPWRDARKHWRIIACHRRKSFLQSLLPRPPRRKTSAQPLGHHRKLTPIPKEVRAHKQIDNQEEDSRGSEGGERWGIDECQHVFVFSLGVALLKASDVLKLTRPSYPLFPPAGTAASP